MANQDQDIWKKCSTCKNPILYKSLYLTCSVSTCNTKRAGMVFCSVRCWDSHVPVMRHKEAFYQEKKAPLSRADEERVIIENLKKDKKIVPEQKPEGKKIIIRKKQM